MRRENDYNKIVNDLIINEFQEEAKQILMLTTETRRKEFIDHYNQEKGNICCLILDKAKYDLVKKNKLQQNPNDGFGIMEWSDD